MTTAIVLYHNIIYSIYVRHIDTLINKICDISRSYVYMQACIYGWMYLCMCIGLYIIIYSYI